MTDLTLNNIPLEWVRAFEVSGRTGSFTSAAEELNVTQAAISQRIANLETRLGRTLFLRGARGITLTVDGEAWLPHVSAAMRDLSESYEDVFGLQREKLTISASASVIELWFTPRLRNWSDGHRPRLVFSTRVFPAPPQETDSKIRVEYGVGEWPSHHKCQLFQERLSPVAAPELASREQSWRDLPLIALSGPRAGWKNWAKATGDTISGEPILRFDSFVAALGAALSGEGVLLASLPLCSKHLAEGTLVRLSQEQLEPLQTYWMLAHEDEITKSFWNRMRAQFEE